MQALLGDARVDPCVFQNDAVKKAFGAGHLQVVRILLQDQRVIQEAGIDDIIGCLKQ